VRLLIAPTLYFDFSKFKSKKNSRREGRERRENKGNGVRGMPFRGIGFIGKFGNGMNGRGMKPKLGEGAGQTGVFVRPPGLEKFARPNTENTSIVSSDPLSFCFASRAATDRADTLL
jgi:hypothetical protein